MNPRQSFIHTFYFSSLKVWIIFNNFMPLFNFMNIWSPVILTVLMPLLDSLSICVSAGSVSIDQFSTKSWIIFSYFFACLVIFQQMTDIVNFALLSVVYFYIPKNILQCFFWDTLKLLGNHLIFSGAAFKICQAELEWYSI